MKVFILLSIFYDDELVEHYQVESVHKTKESAEKEKKRLSQFGDTDYTIEEWEVE